MKNSLRTKLSLTIIFVVAITVALISILSNIFIQSQFKDYISIEQQKTPQEIADNIAKEYDEKNNSWNLDSVHSIGMNVLYEGYIIKVYDKNNEIIWDAENCDIYACSEIMDDITHRMHMNYPSIDGKFISSVLDIKNENGKIGTINICYYGPFFLSENDFRFLNSLNYILIGVGVFSLVFSIVVGVIMAKHISNPIKKTVKTASKIASGDYKARINENASTKEVQELIISINNLASSLDSQEKLRKQLTADIAHEFRTPLTTLQTHMEAMIDGLWEPSTVRLISCQDEIIRITNMVKDLEKLAKVENDNFVLSYSEVSILEIINKSLSNFEIDIKNKGLNISVLGDCSKILADGDRINQVFINLLSNAVKYSKEGGFIIIKLLESKKFVSISIEDNGIGIAKDEVPFIFERFYRADKSRNHNTGGCGIGLAIVKAIILAHKGTINVNSIIEEGSCFVVTLPKTVSIFKK